MIQGRLGCAQSCEIEHEQKEKKIQFSLLLMLWIFKTPYLHLHSKQSNEQCYKEISIRFRYDSCCWHRMTTITAHNDVRM